MTKKPTPRSINGPDATGRPAEPDPTIPTAPEPDAVARPPDVCLAEEEVELTASEAEAERGEFASGEEVRAVWAKHDL